MIKYYAINGQIVSREQAVLSIDDIAILRGYGLFDYFLVKNGHPLFLPDHLDRFFNSAAIMHLRVPISKGELASDIYRLLAANGLPEASIRIVLTGGISENAFAPGLPSLLILQHESPSYPALEFEAGAKLLLHEFMRPLPLAKSTDYAMSIQLLPQLQAASASEVLYHHNGVVHEMSRANFYIVMPDGTIATTTEQVLAGVTRKKLLETARQHYRLEERSIRLEELATAKEAFFSNTTRRVMPVVKIGDLTIGTGRPGPVAIDLRQRLIKVEEAYLAEAEK